MGLCRLTSSAASRSSSHLGEHKLFLGAGGRLPAGQGIGEIAHPLPVLAWSLRTGAPQVLQEEAQLQVGHHKRGGQDFKTENPAQGGRLLCRPD